MNGFETDTQQSALGAAAGAPTGARAGSALNFLLSRDADTRSESRRVLFGFVAMLVLGVIGLNFALYHNAKLRLEREGWARLEASTDLRRDQLARHLDSFRAAALGLARDPEVTRDVLALARGTIDDDQRQSLQAELRTRQDYLHLENVQIISANGQLLESLAPSPPDQRRRVDELARRANASKRDQLDDPLGDELRIAVPILDETGQAAATLVLHSVDRQLLPPLLGSWPGLGPSNGAYLVRPGADAAIVLTYFDGSGLGAGQSIALNSQEAMAATMAATGVESRIEIRNGSGEPAWAVTRRLAGTGWGLVGQADRADMLAGLGATSQGLLLLDLGLAIFVLGMAWVWRRLYASGLARREMEITERHARRVQSVFDTAFDAIFTFDRGGSVRTVNLAAGRLFGRTPDDMDARPIRDLLAWAGDAGAIPVTGTVGAGEALRLDGSRVPVEFSIGATGAGEELIYTAIVRDTSERAEAERRIRSFAEGLENSNRRLEEVNAQLEEGSRLKSEFLANTSHELRTPLNGMIGFLQLVLDGMCDSPEEERDFLGQALQCSRHLLGLINDVLDIAKIEAGKLMLEIDRVDVQQLFDEAYTLSHVQAAQRGITLRFETELEPSAAARGDFGKLKQVLINLIGNAIKFTPKGGITVRAKSHAELGHLMFEVVDTGIGIPPDRQKMIFEKFVQADGSTTRRFGGTGLGLAISRSLIELMGGIIGVYSEGEGHGTRMYFSLPLWRDEPVADPALLPAGEQIQGLPGGALILVVEDDPVFRRFLTAVLQQHGFRTAEADHAEGGWLLVRRLQPSCVVLDYALSCGDGASLRTGWDLAERMTTEPETRRIPLVFVTGFDGELKEKLRATTFARRPEHLVKPVEANDLIARIEALVGDGKSPIRVLMADDDPSVAAYIRKVLPGDRFRVEVANNGEECLHTLRTQPNAFDILLLDLMMPEVSGYDVLREMTLAGIRPDLPVLVLTNFPEPRNEEERLLLEQGLVLDVVAKTAVHENPKLLPHLLEWHLQVAGRRDEAPDQHREAA